MVCCHTSSSLQSHNSQVCPFSFCPNYSDTDKLKGKTEPWEKLLICCTGTFGLVMYESQDDTRPAVYCRDSSAHSITRSTNQTGELWICQKYTRGATSAPVDSRAQRTGQEMGTTSLHLQSLRALQES